MPFWMRMLLAQRYMDEAGGDGGEGGGGSGEGGGEPGKPGDKPTEKEAELLKESMARKAKIKELETQLKAFEGIDPAKIKDLLAAQAQAEADRIAAEQKSLEKAGEFDKVKQQIIDAHKAEKKSLQDMIDALKGDLGKRESAIEDLTIGAEFRGSKFRGEKTTLTLSSARLKYGSHFERDEQGRVVGYDKPRGVAGRAPIVGADGEPLAFDAVLEKLVNSDAEKDEILRANLKPGAGSGSTTTKKTSGGQDEPKMTGRERIAAGLKANKLQPAAQPKLQ
jgi:hypothetical protein